MPLSKCPSPPGPDLLPGKQRQSDNEGYAQRKNEGYAQRKEARAAAVEESWRKLAAETIATIYAPRSLQPLYSAADAVSTVFLAMDACRDKSRAYQWRAGVNAVHDEVRTIRGRNGHRAEQMQHERLSEETELVCTRTGDFTRRVNSRLNMRTLLTLLPDSRWQVVIERFFVDEMLVEDIAAEIGMTIGRVSQMKADALAFLKTIINEDGCLREGDPLL